MLNFSKKMAVIVLMILIHLYVYNSDYVKRIDYKIYDLSSLFFSTIQEQDTDTYSVVVDIDEQSIKSFGQWPWSRIIDAQLIDMIDRMNPSALGVNILFPEEDSLSPLSMQKFYQQHFDVSIDISPLILALQDNDKLLSEAIRSSNATLALYLQNKFDTSEHCQEMRYKKNIFAQQTVSLYGDEILCNHATIQEEVENFGFVNAWEDDDGIFRRVPLFMKYKQEVFPSLALATLLSFYDEVEVNKDEDTVLVNFSSTRPKVISAADILESKVLREDIQGKIVILGSSVVGLSTSYKITNEEHVSNSMIHAVLVDNLLSEALLIQPEFYKKINILFSLLFVIIIFLLLSQKKYVQIIMLLLLLVVISSILLIFFYMNNIYISIGYFWVSLLSVVILLVLYHVSAINKEQQEQENFLVRQSKLASMGEMISLIAHQWRQPLSAINGTVLNMDIDYRKEKLDVKKLDNYLNEIEDTTAYLSKTIDDFTDYFSKNKQSQVFNLLTVINQAKHLSAFSLSKDVEIIDRDYEDIEINGYPSELVQSLLVLLNNAIYVCQKNLKTIGKGKVFIDVKQIRNKVFISVEDNGGGVKKKDMKKIFSPYFTTKDKHNGTGLGLYILKLIVEDSMNGKVSVRNGKEGAVFIIEIPTNIE